MLAKPRKPKSHLTTDKSNLAPVCRPRTKVNYSLRHDHGRCYPDGPKTGDERNAFEIDRSRIIHSAAFRRLSGKTQVFTVGEGDFYRTRLTHSLETAQIGKGLALRLKAHPDLVETICLAHDIGHPPFGHAGEDELRQLMRNDGGFEANAQNIRIVAKLERKSELYKGLNLTRATIDGLLKYKTAYSPTADKFYYTDDKDVIEVIKWAVEDSPDATTLSFECEIMDWADEIAYSVHDLEDAVHARMITGSDFSDDKLISEVLTSVQKKMVAKYDNTVTIDDCKRELNEVRKMVSEYLFVSETNLSTQKSNRKMLTSRLIHYFIASVGRKERNLNSVKENISERYWYAVVIPTEVRIRQLLLNGFLWFKVIQSPNVRTLEWKSRYLVKRLFDAFALSKDSRDLFPEDWRELLDEYIQQRHGVLRFACDYISGMTDSYAARTYARLFLPNYGSIIEVL